MRLHILFALIAFFILTTMPFTFAENEDWITVQGTSDIVYSAGNVGIGVPVPREKLDISGTARVTTLKTSTVEADSIKSNTLYVKNGIISDSGELLVGPNGRKALSLVPPEQGDLLYINKLGSFSGGVIIDSKVSIGGYTPNIQYNLLITGEEGLGGVSVDSTELHAIKARSSSPSYPTLLVESDLHHAVEARTYARDGASEKHYAGIFVGADRGLFASGNLVGIEGVTSSAGSGGVLGKSVDASSVILTEGRLGYRDNNGVTSGVYIEKGDYGVYSKGAKNYFAGNIGIGTAQPKGTLQLGNKLILTHDFSGRAGLYMNVWKDTDGTLKKIENGPSSALILGDSSNSGEIFFSTSGTGQTNNPASLSTRFWITNEGRVSIGGAPAADGHQLSIKSSFGQDPSSAIRAYYEGSVNAPLNAEFAAIAQRNNEWTALYGKKGNAGYAGLFDGDVKVSNGGITLGGVEINSWDDLATPPPQIPRNPGTLCGLHIERKTGNILDYSKTVNCEGRNPKNGCPSGYAQFTAEYGKVGTGTANLWTCVIS